LLVAFYFAATQSLTAYTLHEWGTFTSVSGSDGVLLPGLQREEEGLPRFVESHEGMQNIGGGGSKGWLRPLANVTIKMETPVIYFYSDHAFQAHVDVGFHGGSISQWYPTRSGGENPPPARPPVSPTNATAGAIDFAKGYEGSISWDVSVTPPSPEDSAKIFRGSETANWLFPRQTDSALVQTSNGFAEKFLFYRGVGRLSLPIEFTVSNDNELLVSNHGKADIERVFVFQQNGGDSVGFIEVYGLEAGAHTPVNLASLPQIKNWQRVVYEKMATALVAAGLYRKEADAMLQTWWNSYFERPGLRVFWIVPEITTDEILPLKVDPPPDQRVRVLVGRSEILTPQFEANLQRALANDSLRGDRFYDAYSARAAALRSAKGK
jgi:hypothetical protein